jgi:hypothetical protein
VSHRACSTTAVKRTTWASGRTENPFVGRFPDCAGRRPACMIYNTGVVRLFGSWRFSSGASLVAASVVLCLGALVLWTATGPEVSATPAMADSSQLDQGANGDQHPLNGSYLAVPAEEAEDSDKGPVNADLLTALLLAFSFGMTVGWLLANGRGQEAFCSSGVGPRLSLCPRQDPPSLGVFRL